MNQQIRIVLLGKTGVGKSATGNTILGERIFVSEARASSITKQCACASRMINRRHVWVVDTPGLYDTQLSNEEVLNEIANCIKLAAPGPHVFLLVIAIGRFTEEERNIAEVIHTVFGRAVLKHMMVLFTRADDLEESTFEDYIKETPELKRVINACRGNYHIFNNREMSNRTQVNELMEKIVGIVRQNHNSYYSHPIFTMANELNSVERNIMKKDKMIAELKKQIISLESKTLILQHTKHTKSFCNIL